GECKIETGPPGSAPQIPQGSVSVIDVRRAVREPAKAVIANVPAGCSPVRLALSPNGKTAYVNIRGEDSLRIFDTELWIRDPKNAQLAKVAVGTAPVGVAVIDNGRKIVSTNSNRFAGGPNDHSTLTITDARTMAVLGTIEAG